MTPVPVLVDQDEIRELRCRFGCRAPVGIFHVPDGCVVHADPVQALCMQHLVNISTTGPVTCLIDFRIPVPERVAP